MIVYASRLNLPIDTRLQITVPSPAEVCVSLDNGDPNDRHAIDLVFEVSDAGEEQIDSLITLFIDAAAKLAQRKCDLLEENDRRQIF